MTFWKLYYHIIWATKDRLPFIDPKLESVLFSYLIQKSRSLECKILAVNGCSDHIHLVISIPPKHSIAEIVKLLKGSSSHEFKDLYWLHGYGVLSVSERNLSIAIEFVKNQKQHHADQTTNYWLEHFTETEEGPDSKRDYTQVKEEKEDYSIGETPF